MKKLIGIILCFALVTVIGGALANSFDKNTGTLSIDDWSAWWSQDHEFFWTEYDEQGKPIDVGANPENVKHVIILSGSDIIDFAFYGYSNLESVSIPVGIRSIGASAFYFCSNLTSLNIPNGVTSIGSHAFCVCRNLETINIPNSVQSIGRCAFSNCSKLSAINIPNGVSKIEEQTFYDCSSLTSVSIPDSVKQIGSGAFYNCSSLQNITFPDGISIINSDTFWGCTSLTNFHIPSSVKTIDYCAFSGCTSLESIQIPSNVTSIGNKAFDNCTSLSDVNIQYGLLTIGGGAFSNCTSIKTIQLPDSITQLGNYMFDSCYGLNNVILPKSIDTIPYGIFWDCTGLRTITIPENVTCINAYAFRGCKNIDIYLPDDIDELEYDAIWSYSDEQLTPRCHCSLGSKTAIALSDLDFYYYDGDFKYKYYDLYKYIGNSKSVSILAGTAEIKDDAFSGCNTIQNIQFPSWLSTIGSRAFKDCINIKSVVLPSGLEQICDSAFSGCSNLTSITIPKTVKTIADNSIPYKNKGLVITGYADTQAQKYATKHNVQFHILYQIVVTNKKTVKLGYTYAINPTQLDVTGVTFTYKSSNKNVASVDKKGVVTAKKAGTAVITVTSSHGESASVTITIKSVKIKLNKTKVTLAVKKTFSIKATQSGTKGAKFTFKTSDKKVATVDKNGKITAKKKGTCTITVTSCFGETAKIKVTVK